MRRLLALLLFAALPAAAQYTRNVTAETVNVNGSDSRTVGAACITAGMVPFLGSPVSGGLTCDATVSYTAAAWGLYVATKTGSGALSAAEARGTLVSNYGQLAETTLTLPAAAAGLNFIVTVGTSGAGALHVKAGASDKLYLDGVALDDGDKASLATPAVGNTLTCLSFQTGASAWDWICTSGGGAAWTDGGA